MDTESPDHATAYPFDFNPAVSHGRRRAVERLKHQRPLYQRVRLAARQYADQHPDTEHVCQRLGLYCTSAVTSTSNLEGHRRPGGCDPATLRRTHLEKDLLTNYYLDTSLRVGRQNGAHRKHPTQWENEESLDLARSNVPLPTDGVRLQRLPSLGREDAFCDASTYKIRGCGKVRVQRMPDGDEDAQIAELYRMGLLYDRPEPSFDGSKMDCELSGGVNLNTIHHEEPVYAIRTAKRSRRHHRRHQIHEHPISDTPLNIDLSFADLGADEDLRRYLVSTTPPSTPPHNIDVDEDESQSGRRHTRKVSAPLRVVYELDHHNKSRQPSFDVDTSQPPDLIGDDSLSDYDYFTDSDIDLDEVMPSQEVNHDSEEERGVGATASGAWVLLGDDS